MSTSAFHYAAGEKKLAAAEDMAGRLPADAAVLASIAAAHFDAARAGVAAQAAGLVHGGSDVTKPTPWWTALHGEERS